MNEHGYVKSVHRHIPSHIYRWKINDNYAGGVPDAFYCDIGGMLFVEYKYIPKVPKRGTTYIVPSLSELQKLWLAGRENQNVAVIVVLGTPLGSIVFSSNRTWERGITRDELDLYALPAKEVARIIVDHCIGKSHVSRNEQIYPDTKRPQQSPPAQEALDAA